MGYNMIVGKTLADHSQCSVIDLRFATITLSRTVAFPKYTME